MNATVKMERLTLKVVHERAQVLRPSLALETLYRWRAALRPGGKGITDDNKRLLIAATAATAEPITWADFQPDAAGPPEPTTPGMQDFIGQLHNGDQA